MVLLILTGCEKQPISSQQTDNVNFQVDLLFSKDGCNVYRFYDQGRSIYFVKCDNGNLQTQSTFSCGKNCIDRDIIQTINKN